MKTKRLIYRLVFSLILLFGIGVTGAWADWSIECVDCPKEFTDFHPRAIATDSFNRPHIAYGGNHLYYAYYDGVEWQYETVDSSSRVGSYASIAIDSNNKVHISYYDDTSDDLKYATNSSGSWVTTTIDSAGDVGQYTSIAIDSNNKVHISYSYYYEELMVASYGYLKYATNASESWVTTTVDSYGDSSGASYGTYYTSIALDSNNKVHISYFDAGNVDLKYATNESGSWVTTTIDSAGSVGSYTSIALDSNNKVHISYYDATNYYLKYATNAPIDYDNDGYAVPVDCNDNDTAINPGAAEICDGIDNDCDGSVDEGCNVDLYVNAGSVTAPSSASPGDTITVGATVKKSGTGFATASTARIYIYGDIVGTGNKFKKLGDVAVSSFGAGPGSQAISASVTIPSWVAPGSHQIIVRADLNNDVPEWNESNNRGYKPITIVP